MTRRGSRSRESTQWDDQDRQETALHDVKQALAANRARDVLLSLSQASGSRSQVDTPVRRPSVLCKAAITPAKLSLSVSTNSLRSPKSPIVTADSTPVVVTLQQSASLKTIRMLSAQEETKRREEVQAFVMGRNKINRMLRETATAQRKADTLSLLKRRVFGQRTAFTHREAARQHFSEEPSNRKKLLISISEEELRDWREQLRSSVMEKREQPRSLLHVKSLDPKRIPQVPRRVVTRGQLCALLSPTYRKRFRFK